MSVLKRNIIANFVGRGWSAAMSLIFVPFYLRFLGVEAYGLIGIFSTLLIIFTIFDLGLSTTLNRELARLNAEPGNSRRMRDLVRSMEIVYWLIALALGAIIFVFTPAIAAHWIKPEHLQQQTVVRAFTLMGVVAIVQWPCALYAGGLMGLQQQVRLNAINMSASALRGIGALAILWLVSPSIEAFFIWQAAVSFLQTGITRTVVHSCLPPFAGQPTFRKESLSQVANFAAGLTGITILSIVMTQLDKIVLSGMLPLKSFGYYSIAATAAGGLSYLIGPVFTATFPRFSQLVAEGDEISLAALYHSTAQLMSLIMVPAAVVISFFPREVLLIWTHDATLAENCHLVLLLLVIGNALNGLMNIPYALQLASGWTSLNLFGYLSLSVFMVPFIVYTSKHYGGVGAAASWVCLNVIYFLVAMQIMYRRLLPREKSSWYRRDLGIPILVSIAIAAVGKSIIGHPESQFTLIIALAAVSICTLVGTLLSLSSIRTRLFRIISKAQDRNPTQRVPASSL